MTDCIRLGGPVALGAGALRRLGRADIEQAASSAWKAQAAWAAARVMTRRDVLRRAARLIGDRAEFFSAMAVRQASRRRTRWPRLELRRRWPISSRERDAVSTDALRPAALRTGRVAMTVPRPRGVAGTILPANTPLPNLPWNAFPAQSCGNSVVVKSAEDTSAIALELVRILSHRGEWATGKMGRAPAVFDD